MNHERFKAAMSTLPTGVTVVTCSHNNKIFGFTANSFTSVSLSPPLVSFCIDQAASSVSSFAASDYFAVNILADNQVNFSVHLLNLTLISLLIFLTLLVNILIVR